MDKIKTVKIKNPDGSVSEETYTISVDAKDVDMANGKELQETIGTIDIDTDGNIAEQLENLNDNVDNLNIDIKKKAYFFDTVADMKNANLKAGDYVCTLGYHNFDDGGAANYKIIEGNYVDDKGRYHRLENGLWAELIKDNFINVKQFGAYGDGTHDDTEAIQNAFNYAKRGDSVYFPKSTPARYLISKNLILRGDDVTLYSDPRTEYETRIISNSDITILNVTGYGCKINSLTFWGNGTTDIRSTTNGVVFDRTSLGDQETYSNIDAEIKDCAFFYLNDAVTIKGRNLYFHDNVIVICHRGIVGLLHKYNNNTQISAFRGIRITNNRFHSMNDYYRIEERILDPDTLDSWCIEMPQESNQVHHIEIANNNCDFGHAGFYKGYLCGAFIINNVLHSTTSIFVKSNQNEEALHEESNSYWGVIKNNYIRSYANIGEKTRPLNRNFIILNGCSNIEIDSNVFRGSAQEIVKMEDQGRCYITNNAFQYFGYEGNTTEIQYAAIRIINGNRIHIGNNLISSTIDYSKGISAEGNGSLYITNNHFDGVSTLFDVPASFIKSQEYGLPWIKPELQNNFEYTSELESRGYRKLQDGTVELSLYLQGGTDNVPVFVLPVGYRPATAIRIPNISQWISSSDSAVCQINANGNVIINFDDELLDSSSKRFSINIKFPCAN